MTASQSKGSRIVINLRLPPMDDKSQWPELDPGFIMLPPTLERPAGRPRKQRIKNSAESGKRGPYQCKRCFQFGHIEKTCKNPRLEPDEDVPQPPQKKRKKKATTTTKKKRAASTSSPSTSRATISMMTTAQELEQN